MKKQYKISPYAYAFSIGKIRALETQLIKEDFFKEMIIAHLQKALERWAQLSAYNSEEVLNIKDPLDLEDILNKEEERLDSLIKNLIIDKRLFFILKKSYESPEDSFRRLAEFDAPFLKDYLKHKIDLINIKELLRFKEEKEFLDFGFLPKGKFLEIEGKPQGDIGEAFKNTIYYKIVEGGLDYFNRQGSFIHLERLCDDFLIDFMKAQKFFAFDSGPVLAYYLAKLNELKTLKLIFLGKLSNLEEGFIQSRINKAYV